MLHFVVCGRQDFRRWKMPPHELSCVENVVRLPFIAFRMGNRLVGQVEVFSREPEPFGIGQVRRRR